jgi:hypothetical protein
VYVARRDGADAGALERDAAEINQLSQAVERRVRSPVRNGRADVVWPPLWSALSSLTMHQLAEKREQGKQVLAVLSRLVDRRRGDPGARRRR